MEKAFTFTGAALALGFLAIATQSESKAVSCFAAADALRAKLEIVAWPPDAASVGDACNSLRAVLGEEAFGRHWAEGAALNLDEAVEYVSRSRRTQATEQPAAP